MNYVIALLTFVSALACSLHAQIVITTEPLPEWAASVQTIGPFDWPTPPQTLTISGLVFEKQTVNPAAFILGDTVDGRWSADVFFNGGFAMWGSTIGLITASPESILWDSPTPVASPIGYHLSSLTGAPTKLAFSFTNNGVMTRQSDASKVALYMSTVSATEKYFYMVYNDEFLLDHDFNDQQIFGRLYSPPFVSVPEPSTYALMAGSLAVGAVFLRRKYRT